MKEPPHTAIWRPPTWSQESLAAMEDPGDLDALTPEQLRQAVENYDREIQVSAQAVDFMNREA